MANEQRGHRTIEVGGEKKTFKLSLADWEEIEKRFETDSLTDLAKHIEDWGISDTIFVLDLGIEDCTKDEIREGVTKVGNAMSVCIATLMDGINPDLDDEDIPEEMAEEVEKQKEKARREAEIKREQAEGQNAEKRPT
jgi:hypothetical protein